MILTLTPQPQPSNQTLISGVRMEGPVMVTNEWGKVVTTVIVFK